MTTDKQKLGDWGEKLVAKKCSCPKCKKERTLKTLPTNFKCVDIVCDFCGYLAQVKTKTVKNIDSLPSSIPGAAWALKRKEWTQASIFHCTLFLKLTKRMLSTICL